MTTNNSSIIDAFKLKYDVKESAFAIDDHHMTFLVPTTIEPFINPDDLMNDFPLWSKIWEATAILAHRISKIKPDPEKRFLELGAGMGVAGISAAKMGHRITITEYNKDALNFARVNAALNRIINPDIRELDWNSPFVEGKFDYIIGSEIVFKEADIFSIGLLFQQYLKPGGTIILAEGMRKTTLRFVKEMEKLYTVSMRKQIIRSETKEIPIILFEMQEK